MKRLLVLVLAALCAPTAAAQVSAFSYRAERAPAPGTVWHYTKSNRDGSKPWHLDAYIASPTRITVVKWVEGASDFVEVTADLSLAQAMPVNLQQWNTAAHRREPKLYASSTDGKTMHAVLADGQTFDLHAAQGPLNFWGFDLMGVAFMLPHLADPTKAFEMSFINTNQPGTHGQPLDVDVVRFEPAGMETIEGVACRKFKLTGPLFGDQTGFVWIDASTGRLERAEHAVPTSTDWSDWRLDRVSSETMDGIAWEKFKLGLADAQAGGGGTRSAAGAMKTAYDKAGIAAAFEAGEQFKRDSLKAFEGDLNTFGYALLGFGKNEDALAVFQRAARDYPQSANAWDSLGEAQAAAGRKAEAIASYRKSLQLDPGNDNARKQIEALAK
ncbi:tetratricopeptide repeat protein [Arenimonas oryziterrae]|uniref:Uncharacterized protein n=1 Tax=Arenimonas oryziterrae DSM 21050 = YC6267 TaxID=1121015 RepID=A0A091AZV0_9GAMM|nr:tetratricopeptide repeat protein [Arenimonas oryziterrae]KFN44837.1 hypothetical protein N789_02135 [Arenimonas oryziterrae DSM 21050 = YC6267]